MSALGYLVLIVFGTYLLFWLVWKLFGKRIMQYAAKTLIKKAQQDMDRQSRAYQQHVQDYTPFEENVYVEDDVKVSIRRGSKHDPEKKPDLKDLSIETVEYEDLD